MSFFEFPNTRTYNNDLGWLIREIQRVDAKLDEYLKSSVITIADPIQWSITTQYPRYNMVISNDGTAYLSRQPVPAGVPLTDTDYWQPIFNYDDSIKKIRSAIASVEDTNIATVTRYAGDLVFVGGTLYEVIETIPVGAEYVPGTNVKTVSVESILDEFKAGIDAEMKRLEELVESALDLGTGSVYCDNVLCMEFRNNVHNNFWGGVVLNNYLYQYCADGNVDAGTGKIMKINTRTGEIVKIINQDLYWGNALTTDGTFVYALYGDTTTTARIYKFDGDLEYIGVVSVVMSVYPESLTWNGDGLELIAINRNTHSAFVRTVSADLSTVSAEQTFAYNIDADLHNSFISYHNGYCGITIRKPYRMVFLNKNFNLLRAMPFDERAFNNAVAIGEVEGMCYDPESDLFYINGQLSQTAAAFQDYTMLILHSAKIDSAPTSYKALGATYYNTQTLELFCNISTGSINGDGSASAPFKCPIAANSAMQYYSALGYRTVLNFTADQDLSDYILALNGIENAQIYTRNYTMLGLHMYRCSNVEFNADLNLSGERIVGTGYRGAQADMYYCFGCQFNGNVTMNTGTNAQVSLRVVRSYDNYFKSLTTNKGYSDDTGIGFTVGEGPTEKMSVYNLHGHPYMLVNADNIRGFAQNVINNFYGKVGSWFIPATWAGHWAGQVSITGINAQRLTGIIIPQLENTANMFYVFSYDNGNLRVASVTGTAIN